MHHRRVRDVIVIAAVAIALSLVLKTFVIDAVRLPSSSMEKTLLPGDYIIVNKLVYGAKSHRYIPFTRIALPSFSLPALKSIERGNVIVFELPEEIIHTLNDSPVIFVKRCVGLAGDTVAIADGYLRVNNRDITLNDGDDGGIDGSFEPTVIPKRGMLIELNAQGIMKWRSIIEREGHRISCSEKGAIIDGKPVGSYTIERNYLFVIGDNINHSYDSRTWGFLPEENVIGQAMMVYWSIETMHEDWNTGNFFSSIRWSRIGTLIH